MNRCLLLMFAFLPALATGDDADAIEGVWINGDGDGLIELRIDDGELVGRIAGSPDDPDNRKPSRLDSKNPQPELRSRPLLGLTILSGFRFTGDGKWSDGRIYDPNSGKNYKGTITVVDGNTLALRGFVGISLFGRTETWRRQD